MQPNLRGWRFSFRENRAITIASRNQATKFVRMSQQSSNLFGGTIMQPIMLKTAVALSSLWLAGAGAGAQEWRTDSNKDLTVKMGSLTAQERPLESRNDLTVKMASLTVPGAAAQEWRVDSDKDLTVETVKPASHRPAKHHAARAVQVSLMPLGSSTIAIGDPSRFKMVSLADGFGHLYVLSASGRTQLWLENVRIQAGQPLLYPRPGQIVRATAPAGDETVIFIASRKRIDGFGGAGRTTTPLDLQFTHEGLRTAIQQKFGDMPRDDWAFAEIRIRVHE
jgi:hypothetical protein